jgi:hypothetical protein
MPGNATENATTIADAMATETIEFVFIAASIIPGPTGWIIPGPTGWAVTGNGGYRNFSQK